MGAKRVKSWKFQETLNAFKRKRKGLPKKIGNIAKNHFIKSFSDQGFTNKSLVKWKVRKKPDLRGKGRAILVLKGRLRRSVRVKSARFERIVIMAGGAGVDYARLHNRGTSVLPKRQFMGKSIRLTLVIRDRVRKEIKKTFIK